MKKKIVEMIKSEGRLAAVKWYLDNHNRNLVEAKSVVDSIMIKHQIPLQDTSGPGCSIIILIGIGLTIGAMSLL